MKRVKNAGINSRNKTLLNKLEKFDRGFLIDVVISNMTTNLFKNYFPNCNTYENFVIELINAIKNNDFVVNKFLVDLISINDRNVKKYLNVQLPVLEFEYDKDVSPAYSGVEGISPDMMIFYYITHNLNEDNIYRLSVNKYTQGYEDYKKNFEQQKADYIKIPNMEETAVEFELNSFYHGNIRTVSNISFEDRYKEIAERYKGTYENGKILVDSNILLFFDTKLKDIVETRNIVNEHEEYAITLFKIATKVMNAVKDKYDNLIEVYTENDSLKLENQMLNKEKAFLNSKIEEVSQKNNNEKLLELEKENYYLKTRLEKLETEKAELLEEIESIKEIKENIVIGEKDIPETTVMLYNNENIAVIGGFWNSKEKADVQSTYKADFIESEDVLKNRSRIKNYDIVIFDTSRNSHINFFKCKTIAKKLLLISKSKKENIDSLFTKII